MSGKFKVGDIIYQYSIRHLANHPYKNEKDNNSFFNIQFTPKGEMTSILQMGKENYIKILSTMYKIIVDFVEKEKPEYVGIASLDNNGKNYHKVYANLTDNKSNNIPGYFRKDVNLEFNTPQGKGRFIVLKRKKAINENASYSQTIDLKKEIAKLTKHMIDKGMNIQPLPKLIFKNGDSENAKEFLGKTAYYDPNSMSIVLYTEGRHPKDIVRSFSHEMVHHTQNLENRLGNITSTNTQEDDELDKIEQEANLTGTMTFRNWTDSLNEYNNSGPSTPKVYIVKDNGTYKEAPIGLLSKISNLTYDMGGGETNYYPEKNIVIVDNIPVEEFAKEPGDIKGEKIYVEYNLNNPTTLPKANKIIASQLVYHLDNSKAFAQTISNSLKDGGIFEFFSDIMSKEDKIFLEYLSSEFGFGIPTTLSKYKNSIIQIKKGKYITPLESYIYEVTDDAGNVSKISATKKGLWWKYVKVEGNLNFKPIEALNPEYFNQMSGISPSKALEETLDLFSQITDHNIVNIKKINPPNIDQSKFTNEAIVGEKIECDNCDWSWDIIDGGDDLFMCHKCGHDNTPLSEKKTKDPFGINAYAMELGRLFEEEDRLMAEVVNPDGERFEYKESNISGLYIYKDSRNNLYFARILYQNISNPHFEFKVGWFEDNDISKPKYEPQLPPKAISIDNLKRRNTISKIYRDEIIPYFKEKTHLSNKLTINPISDLRYTFSKRLVQNYTPENFDIQYDDEDKKYIKILSNNIEEKKNKNPFGLNAYAMELGRLREEDEKPKYIIYCDLDGVLVDFNKGYKDLTGKDTKNADRQGSEYFWGLYRDSLKEKGMSEKDYFENLPWESDGKELWDYIEKYNPFILTAPSVNRDVPKEIRYKMEGNQSMQGKAEWVKRLNNVKKTLYKSSKFKHQFAGRNRILIDDRKDTIDRWNNAGGIGILHTDTKNTINQLQDLGL